MPTDLRAARFYGILDTGYVPRHAWSRLCSALIAGGADIIQIRAKRETSAEREALLEEILPLFDVPGSLPLERLVINDDIELCAKHTRIGLHIGQEDTPPVEARARIGPDRVIGLSTHSWEQAAAAQALPEGLLDYFAVGPVFSTQTKPDYTPVGLSLAERVAAARPRLPWFAIGGINRGNIAQVVSAGVPRVVVVSDALLAADPAAAVREIRSVFA